MTVPTDLVDDVIARRPTLAGEQREMLERVTGSGGRLRCVCDRAGTGKTFALAAAREAWEAAGVEVIGAAVARRAARELRARRRDPGHQRPRPAP